MAVSPAILDYETDPPHTVVTGEWV